MYTAFDFTAALPAALPEGLRGIAVNPDGTRKTTPEVIAILAGDEGDDCFTADGDGIWFCCGNEDAYFPYNGPHDGQQVAAALAKMYTEWGITYTEERGISA